MITKVTHYSLGPKGRFHQAKRLKETTPLRHIYKKNRRCFPGIGGSLLDRLGLLLEVANGVVNRLALVLTVKQQREVVGTQP